MTIPYIPGWWDSISESATKLAGQLPSVIQPNNVAKKKFEQMVRENPMILDQLSNLDETQRAAFGKALGYTDAAQNPIMGMPEGEVLKGRREKAKYLAGQTPDEKKSFLTKTYGGESQETIDRGRTEVKQKDVLYNQTVTGNDQTARLNDLKLREQKIDTDTKEQYKMVQDALRIKFPTENIDLGKFTDDFINKKAPADLISRVQGDPTLGPAFKTYLEMYMEDLKIRAQKSIAGMRSPTERYLGLNFLQQDVDNALGAVNAAQKGVNDLVATSKFNPNDPLTIKANKDLAEAKETWNTATSRFRKATEIDMKPRYGEAVFGKGEGKSGTTVTTATTSSAGGKPRELFGAIKDSAASAKDAEKEALMQEWVTSINTIRDPQKKQAAMIKFKNTFGRPFPL